ncbi:MAG: hypothetical protein NXH85_17580 [Pseudomonadaceae bacterium]|nr:hypothetical protein [Pseudomonadaceae bacterium]
MLTRSLQVSADDFFRETGWQIKPEGACKGQMCVPLDSKAGTTVDLSELAPKLGMATVEHDGRYAIGPESLGSKALVTAEAANIRLPDVDGKPFELSSLRGQKIIVYAWAPY